MVLQKVTVNFYQNNVTTQWKERFNQATFFNYDAVNPLMLQKQVIPPAQILVVGGKNYILPAFLEISLNVGEVNDTMFVIDPGNSDTANYQITYTQYVENA